MSADPRTDWLVLRAVAGVGDATYCRLIEAFGSPAAVLAAPPEALSLRGLRPQAVEALRRGPAADVRRAADEELKALDRQKIRLITWQDAAYPARLRTIHDPPPLLYLTGTWDPSDDVAVAVVGSRHASLAGRLFTERLSRELAGLGVTIVSGLARGIDGAAHRGALAGGGRTIAVLGCGLDQSYPPEHTRLRAEVEQHGAVLGELPPGAPPLASHFPRRNRLISGLALGVVVAEAAQESGSLITARLAAEQGREVFAVPSFPGRQAGGTNGLIKQGAKLTETVEDVIEELWPQLSEEVQRRARVSTVPAAIATPLLGCDEEKLFELMSEEPVHVDDAIDRTGFTPATVSGVLLALEIKGLVRQLPGHFFVRI
jgi:DNA processing protein